MAVKIRLARHGAKKRPYYRIVVADSRSPRDGRFIEEVGRYNPCTHPHLIQFDMEKVDRWIADGAQPTDRQQLRDAIGGLGATNGNAIRKSECIALPDLLSEGVHRLEIEDFPVVVAIDADGGSIYGKRT